MEKSDLEKGLEVEAEIRERRKQRQDERFARELEARMQGVEAELKRSNVALEGDRIKIEREKMILETNKVFLQIRRAELARIKAEPAYGAQHTEQLDKILEGINQLTVAVNGLHSPTWQPWQPWYPWQIVTYTSGDITAENPPEGG